MFLNLRVFAFFVSTIILSLNAIALNEIEPNQTFTTANHTIQDSIMNGTVATSNQDYFWTVPDDDGTIKLYFNYTSTVSTTDFFLYAYNKNGGLIGNTYLYNVGVGSFLDSVTLFCRLQDTLYFRIQSSGTISYNFTYQTIPSGTNDVEPNNSFAEANYALFSDTIKGRIGYSSVSPDPNDYFITSLPTFGTINLYLEYNNTSGSATSDFFSYVYNKSGGLIGNSFKYNLPLGITYDTIVIYCRELDSIYFRFGSSGCFSYNVHYDVYAPTQNDIEPNNTFAEANWFNHTDTIEGRVGYTSVSTDNNDYFFSSLPDDGTIEYIIKYYNTSNSTSSDFYSYIYNKNHGLIGSSYKYNQPLGVTYDTIRVHCRAKDTVFFRTQSSGCFSYEFKYRVIPSGLTDVEPNNSFAEANWFNHTDTVEGRVGYASISTDNNDYFFSTLPDDGTIEYIIKYNNTSNSTSSDFFSYIYNKNHGLIGNSYKYNQPLGVTYDTIRVHCRAKDTVFFRTQSSGCFSYEFNYKVIPSGLTDVEPNNSFAEAAFFLHTDTVEGRIGHSSVVTDSYDYFFSTLPDDGTIEYIIKYNNTSNSTSSNFFSYIYNKNHGLIGNSYKYNQPLGVTYDTIRVYCRAKDTVFFRIQSSGCFSYEFNYKVIPSGLTDVEPNNSFAEATLIDLSNQLTGRIGHASVTTDSDDYFKFYNSDYSNTTSYVEYDNTSNSNQSDIFFYLYNSSGSVVFSKYNYNAGIGTKQDTLLMTCLPQDTFYLRVSSSGCFSYKMDFVVTDQQPTAKIVSHQLGDVIGFRAKTNNADSFLWDFDDGTTSTLRYPKKIFPIGTYHVTLTATNASCGISDIDSLLVTIKGIEYFTPKSSGPGGDVLMQVFGGGLDTNTQVTITNSSLEFKPIQKFARKDGSELQVLMDLHFADSGLYDVIIEIPGEPAITYPDSFKVESFQYPYTVSEIIGPSRWRINRDTRFVLSVENTGNVIASGAVAYLIWPKNVDVDFQTDWFSPPDSGTYEMELEDTTVTMYWSFVAPFYDSAFAAPTPIDSLAGKPFDGFVKIIWIQTIAANSTYEIPFLASTTSAGDVSFITYTSKPNLFGSGGNGTYLDWIENGGYAGAEILSTAVGNSPLDKTPVGWLTKAMAGTTKGVANLGTVMGATASYLEGNTNSISAGLPAGFDQNVSAQNAQTGSAIIGVVTDKAVDVGTANLFKGQQNNINKWVVNNPDANINSILLASESLKNINDARQLIKDSYKTVKDLQAAKGKFERLQKMAKDCPELKKQLKFLENEIDKELSQRDKKKKDSKAVVSMDPNAIYGPTGVGTNQFVNHTSRHSFMVTFENVDTATADAQIVTVNVPIDTNAFDMKTFAFGDVSIGSKTYEIPISRNQFVMDLDLREERGMDVRVQAKLDFETGIVTWQYISLDTITGDFPLLDGFLPPNINTPEGEGSAMFSISPKENITDGYKTISQASIVFDENDPIVTDTWENTIDRNPSTSQVSVNGVGDTIYVDFNGIDAQSGVGFYYLYISEDNGTNWLSLDGTVNSNLKIVGEQGVTYSFYSRSVDNVGNKEFKAPTVEASISIKGDQESPFGPSFQLYPNPSNGIVNIKSNGNFYDMDVVISDVLGRVVSEFKLDATLATDQFMDFSNYANGAYFIFFKTINGNTTSNKLVLFKNK